MKRIVWLALALLAWQGCEPAPPTTEVLVVVDSNLVAGRDLSQVQVQVRDRAGRKQLRGQGFALDSKSQLPLSFSLYPSGGASTLRLVVTGIGLRDGLLADQVERQVLVTFVPEQRMVLTIYLDASCLGKLCRDDGGKRTDLTCTEGVCGPTAEAMLTPSGDGAFGGYGLDGGISIPGDNLVTDAGGPSRDGGSDAGTRSIACTNQSTCTPWLGTVDPPGCAVAHCVDGRCSFEAADMDGDGDRTTFCQASGVELVLGGDCNDSDSTISSLEWDGPAGMIGTVEHIDRCDHLDNDCNVLVDDGRIGGATCTCDPVADIDVPCSQLPDGTTITWPAGAPVGACKAGKRSCVDGAWTACVGAVTALPQDNCSVANDDSNCNGVQGEGCECADGTTRPCGIAVGSCKSGMQTCSAGKWSSGCVGAGTPAAADSCDNGNDDNCNGVANEGCKCINGSVSNCGRALPSLGDCLDRPVVCTGGQWPHETCAAQCNDCPATDPCLPGRCIDGQHTYGCDCPEGYVGDGSSNCIKISKCPADNPCTPGTCNDDVATTYSCTCPIGFQGDGTQTCTSSVKICPSFSGGGGAGTGVRCGANTHCAFGASTQCECDTGFTMIANYDPPSCTPPAEN